VLYTLSARVGSVGDNCLGGWYAYRVFMATLNQIVRTASIELARRAPEAICIALHLGIVDTALFTPFSKSGFNTDNSGDFFDWRGAVSVIYAKGGGLIT